MSKDENDRRMIGFHVSEKQHTKLRRIAAEKDVSIASLMRLLAVKEIQRADSSQSKTAKTEKPRKKKNAKVTG